METMLFIDSLFLMPVAAVAVIVAIVLLVKQRKKLGVRPPYARAFRIAAILLLLFAVVVFIVIPMIYLIYMIARFGLAFIYSGAKSL